MNSIELNAAQALKKLLGGRGGGGGTLHTKQYKF